MNDRKSPSKDSQKDKGDATSYDPAATTVGGETLHIRLLAILLEQKLISPAQAQLLLADQEVTGMTVDEVVLARGWITEEKLDEIAPWRKEPVESKDVLHVSAGSKEYQHNFDQYRALMESILGMSWD